MTTEALEAFIAFVLYIRGAIGSHNSDLESLWSNKWGDPIIKATMFRNRLIIKYLRFDHKFSRRQRLNEVWSKVLDDCWQRCKLYNKCFHSPWERWSQTYWGAFRWLGRKEIDGTLHQQSQLLVTTFSLQFD